MEIISRIVARIISKIIIIIQTKQKKKKKRVFDHFGPFFRGYLALIII
jgi:hypothetical protein